jgi:hypothetical protein
LPQQRPRRRVSCGAAHGALEVRTLEAGAPESGALDARTLARMPIPAISTSTVLPSLIDPIPTDVPQAITSPGNSDMSWEILLTSSSGGMIMSDKG